LQVPSTSEDNIKRTAIAKTSTSISSTSVCNTKTDRNSHFDCTKEVAYRSYPNTIMSDWKATIIRDFPMNSVTIGLSTSVTRSYHNWTWLTCTRHVQTKLYHLLLICQHLHKQEQAPISSEELILCDYTSQRPQRDRMTRHVSKSVLYVLQVLGVIKVPNRKTDLQGYSIALAMM